MDDEVKEAHKWANTYLKDMIERHDGRAVDCSREIATLLFSFMAQFDDDEEALKVVDFFKQSLGVITSLHGLNAVKTPNSDET